MSTARPTMAQLLERIDASDKRAYEAHKHADDAHKRADDAHALHASNAAELHEIGVLVRALHHELMTPQAGYSETAIQRMMKRTIDAEASEKVGRLVIFWGSVVVGGLAIVSAFVAAIRFGGPTQ